VIRETIEMTTRVSDLDTQRHVTSRTYESFCLEGRHRLLEKQGYSVGRLLDEGIHLVPTHSYVRFMYQQYAGAVLVIHTTAASDNKKGIIWDQKVEQLDGKPVCHIQLRTEFFQGEDRLTLMDAGDAEFEILYEDLAEFKGGAQQIESSYTPLYCERDIFGSYSPSLLWKVFEEGRWLFCARTGLTYEKFVEMDTTSFYMGGVFNFFGRMIAGKPLRIRTWIDSLEKIRFYFRQDVFDGDRLLMSLRDEQLIVSLKNARPRKAPTEFISFIESYIEKSK
jgi:acyl-CoA thioesterase FadM